MVFEGVSLSVDSETFWVASAIPLRVLSSSVVGGDMEETRHILSVRIPADPNFRDFALRRPRAYLKERTEALGIDEPVVGLSTSLDHERLQVATYAEGEIKASALTTVGLTYLSAPGRHNVVYTGESGQGTINLMVLIDARLSPGELCTKSTLFC